MMKLIMKVKKIFFFVLNFYRYKKIGFKAYIEKNVQINNKKTIEILASSHISRFSFLYSVDNKSQIKIGRRTVIGQLNHFVSLKLIEIGDDVITGQNVFISDNNHNYLDISKPIKEQGLKFKKQVKIGNGSWLGNNCVIIGCEIGKNCVIGANSLVTSDIPDYCVAVGSPAKIIKRFSLNRKKWINSDV